VICYSLHLPKYPAPAAYQFVMIFVLPTLHAEVQIHARNVVCGNFLCTKPFTNHSQLVTPNVFAHCSFWDFATYLLLVGGKCSATIPVKKPVLKPKPIKKPFLKPKPVKKPVLKPKPVRKPKIRRSYRQRMA